MVTRGGSNDLHGNLFLLHTGGGLTANSWGNKYSGTPRLGYTQNQFGAAVGGPIIKNKLFFFADYEGLRYNDLGMKSSSVPTSAMRGLAATSKFDTSSNCPAHYGDFSVLVAVHDDHMWNNTKGTNNETLYPGNCVPISPSNTLANLLISHPSAFPTPNHATNPGGVVGGNYLGAAASLQRNDQGDARLDYTRNTKNTLMVKYSYGDAWDTPTQVPVEAVIPLTDDYPFTNVVAAWTHTFSPTIVNNARAGFTRRCV